MNPQNASNDYQSVALEVAEIVSRKNHDYGDSFHDSYSRFGDLSSVIRLTDKIKRLETLMTHEARVVNESIEDVYRDIAGYAILSLVSRRRMELNKNKGDF
mgnify:CR=1 FL=1